MLMYQLYSNRLSKMPGNESGSQLVKPWREKLPREIIFNCLGGKETRNLNPLTIRTAFAVCLVLNSSQEAKIMKD